MCVEERWYLHRLIHVINCQRYCLTILWFECRLSSNQIRTNDVRNGVSLVVVSSSIHHYIFWVWQILSPCSHSCGIPSSWKPGWIVVEPISNTATFSMICVEHPASIGNFYKHYLRAPFMKHMLGWKKWLSLILVQLMQVAAMNLRRLVYLLWNHSESAMHVQSIPWSVRLIIFIPYEFRSTLSHWLICSRIISFKC